MIKNFRDLLNDRRRIEAFRKTIVELVNHSSTVVEIGTALGTYSFFAARAGAKSIYAIEMDDIIYVGKEIARQNNLLDRIKFIHNISTNTEIPERVDFIIMEDYSPFFLHSNLEQIIIDARTRFLKEGGKFIPNIILLKIAPVECSSFYNSINLWAKENDLIFDIDWSHTKDLVLNQPHYVENHQVKSLAKEILIKEIDLSADSNFTFSFSKQLKIIKSGTLHGLLGWWDCWFSPKHFFSNSPDAPSNSWGQMFFPLRDPVQVKKGDSLQIDIQALESIHSHEIHYKWRIEHESGIQELNTFQGSTFNIEKLKTSNLSHTPRLNSNGIVTRLILGQIDGKNSWEEIAKKLMNQLPKYFSNLDDAYCKIAEVPRKFIKKDENL